MQKYPIRSYTSFWGTGKGSLEDSILGVFLRVRVSWKTKTVRQPPSLFFYFSAGAGAGVRLYSKVAAKLQLSALETSATAINQMLEAAPAYRNRAGGSKTQPCVAGPVVLLTTNPAHLHCQPHLLLQLTEADRCVRCA